MTYLKYVRLHNCCQHKVVELEVGPGLVVLTGAMGSGKTNLLELIFASLTNDFKELKGTKKMNIRRGAEKQPSFMQTGWQTSGGDEFEVNRYLQKGDSAIFVNGQDVGLRAEADITNKVALLLGCDPKTIRTNCFVPQKNTAAIVEQLDTDRAKFWASLLGAEWLLQLQDPVSKAIEQITPMILHDWQSEIDQLSREIETNLHASSQVEQTIEAWEQTMCTEEEYKEAQLVLVRYAELEKTRKNRALILQKLSTAKLSLEKAEKQLAPLQLKLKSLTDQLERAMSQSAAVQHNLRIEDAKKRLQHVRDNKPSMTMDSPGAPKDKKPDVAEFKKMELRLAELNRHIQLYERGKSVCSECGQAIKRDEKEYEENKVEAKELKSALSKIEQINAAWQRFDKQMEERNRAQEAYKKDLIIWKQQMLEANQAVTQIGEPKEVDTELPTEKAIRRSIESIRAEIAKIGVKETVESMQASIAKLEGELAATEAQLAQSVSSVLADAAQKRVEAYEEASHQIGMFKQTLAHSKGKVSQCRESLLAAQQKQMVQRPLVERKAALEQAKKLLRPAELPSMVLSSAAENMIIKANAICEQLDLPFQVVMSNSFDLSVVHADGSEEPVTRLSCGQAACVSVALWIAKLTSCDTGLDVLVLDEPSANMDATGVRMFAEMLLSLGEFLQASKLQVWLTTHHRQLANCGQYHLHLGA